MHDPNYLLHVSEGAEEIAEQLHGEIIKRIVNRIMLRIGRGDDYILTAQDKWQLQVLQDAGYLLEDIQKEIAKTTKIQQEEIAEAMEEAGVKSLEYDDELYRSVGLNPTPLRQSPELIRIAQRNYEATIYEWTNFTRTMAHQSQQLFIKECDRAYTLVSSGALSYTEAVKEVINNIVSEGVKVEYKRLDENGKLYVHHTDTIETATLRAVRTGISQMSAQITDARMEEMNWDIILVSSHLGARVTDKEDYTNHYWWQGKFYSKSGTDPRFPPYSDCGFGKVQGIHGANCRHSHGPGDGIHNPFKDYDSEENRKQYEKEQRQRTLERRIRDTKREVMGLKESVDNCTDKNAKFEQNLQYQKKAALLKKQNKAYKEYCEANNLRTRADRIQIAKWDRKQAAAARGAAKRYENAANIPNRNIISDVRYMKKKSEFSNIAKSINNELDDICVNKSKWSGKITITDNFVGNGRKEWDCSITLKPTAEYADVLHELLHARSISYSKEKDYIKFYSIEEGSVELLTGEICKRKNISYVEAYKEQVKHLRRINRRSKLYENDYDFAKELINVNVEDRIEWLIKKVSSNYSLGMVSDKELQGIWESFKILVEEYKI